MTNLQIQSIRSPFDHPRVAAAAIAALSRADAMGLLSRQITCLDDNAMLGLENGMAQAGIGQAFLSELHCLPSADPARLSALLEKINEALDESPIPTREWPALQAILGLDLIARLLCISQSSARRYLSGTRTTPDTIADRLHFLALLVGDLGGAYNEIGIRRWFDRPRKLLDGNTPAQLLSDNWLPNDQGPQRVRDLARALASSPST